MLLRNIYELIYLLITRRIVFAFFMMSDLQIFIIFIVSCVIDDWQIEILQIKKIINCCSKC